MERGSDILKHLQIKPSLVFDAEEYTIAEILSLLLDGLQRGKIKLHF